MRLLTVTRVGPAGSDRLNQRIEARLAALEGRDPQRRWYHGRPLIVLSNDDRAGLFNGDLGVCLMDRAGQPWVWVRGGDGPRALLPSSLPAHESAYALTVHKSQGSELDHVHLSLPEVATPLLTRELLYTAVTRARQAVTLYGPAAALGRGVRRPTERHSGLAGRL